MARVSLAAVVPATEGASDGKPVRRWLLRSGAGCVYPVLGLLALSACGSSDEPDTDQESNQPGPGGAGNTDPAADGATPPGPTSEPPAAGAGAPNSPSVDPPPISVGPDGAAGVQVNLGTGAALTCVPLCTGSADPGDDFGFENGASCIIPGTATATNDPCTTGQALPEPLPRPGVVVLGATGDRECVAQCVFFTSSTQVGANSDGFADDFAFENNASCIIPGTVTALTTVACTTGEPAPAEVSRPGVVVLNPALGGLECTPLCDFFQNPNQSGADGDALGDDYAFENTRSCVIPDTLTALANQACTTLQPLPPAEQRPGIIINSDPVLDSCTTNACVPFCQVSVAPSDPAFPDWSWENNASCVMPGSPTATTITNSLINHGYELAPRPCLHNAPPVDFLAPPALDPARDVFGHFQTQGAQLLDPYGNPFLIRGVNNSNCWYDICGQYAAYRALDDISTMGANTVRIGWAFESIEPVGEELTPVIGTNPQLLAEVLHHLVELQMVGILTVNDTTGQTDTSGGPGPVEAAGFWSQPGYIEVLQAYEPYVMVGLGNEWNGLHTGTNVYASVYTDAIQTLRGNGINNTIVVTGNAFGQGCDSVLQNAAALTNADPLGNVLYDMHMYTFIQIGGVSGGTAAEVSGCLNALDQAGIPTVVGEFGQAHGALMTPVEWQTIVASANANGQGLIPWLWYGDTEFSYLNLATRWTFADGGQLTQWGSDVLPMVMTPTTPRASIFD